MIKPAILILLVSSFAPNAMAARQHSMSGSASRVSVERCIKPDTSEGPGLYLVLSISNGSSRTISYDLSESTALPLLHLLSVDIEKPINEVTGKWESRAVEIGSYLGPSGALQIKPGYRAVLMAYIERQVVKEVLEGRKLRVVLIDSKQHETASPILVLSGLPGCTLE